MVGPLMYIWNIRPGDPVWQYIWNLYKNKNIQRKPFERWRFEQSEIRGDIILKTNKGEVIVKVGDYVIINPDGSYFDDLQYLKNNI